MAWRLLIVALSILQPATCRGDYSQQIDRLTEPLIEGKAVVGCVVGVTKDGQHEVHAYGEVRRGSGQRPDGDTIYEIGSLTKALTGTLLADMVERGLVKLDDPLQEYVPEGVKVPLADSQPITLLHLATHTSGLPRLPDNMPMGDPADPYADYTADLMYAFLGSCKLPRPPGEMEYSNFGMGLLGHVLAERAGKSYEECVVERICNPLAMQDTRITLSDEQRARLAPPYNFALADDKNWHFQAMAGAGAFCSTCDDLLKLLDAALSDDQRPVVRALHVAWEKRHGKPGEIGIGLGWHIARDGVTRWHNGETGGYSAAVFAFPPARLGVVVVSNTAVPLATPLTTQLAEKVLQSLLGVPVEPNRQRKEIAVPVAILEQYQGQYELVPSFSITVTVEDGRLMAQATGQASFQLFAESETEFFYKAVDAQITFVRDHDGKVQKLILHQGGRDMPAMKKQNAADP